MNLHAYHPVRGKSSAVLAVETPGPYFRVLNPACKAVLNRQVLLAAGEDRLDVEGPKSGGRSPRSIRTFRGDRYRFRLLNDFRRLGDRSDGYFQDQGRVIVARNGERQEHQTDQCEEEEAFRHPTNECNPKANR